MRTTISQGHTQYVAHNTHPFPTWQFIKHLLGSHVELQADNFFFTHTEKKPQKPTKTRSCTHSEWVSDLVFLFVFVYCSVLRVLMTERDNKERKMSEVRLFGMTIELPETMAAAEESGGAISARCDAAGEDGSDQEPPCSSDSMLEDGGLNGHAEEEESRESLSSPKQDHAKDEDRTEELKDSRDSRAITQDRNAPSETEAGSEKMTKNEDDQNEMSNSQDKTLKKPDKLLPCPRCNSMDTKFCYFNNYNVNQPRHFCKNCQRYWTAGGTMRNVPVGAGRRKNKNSIPQFRHLAAPEARVDGYHRAALNPNGTVLTFGSDSPLCESMASVLNIADKTNCNGSRNRFHRPEEVEISVSDRSKESGDDSSTTASSSKDEVGRINGLPEMMPNCHPFPQQVPCYPGGPWPYPWRPVQWNSAVSPPSFPVPFYAAAPPPYWACAVPSAWVMPRAPPLSSGPNSPTLGKHSRDENVPKPGNAEEGAPKESNLEKNLWFPKTLRIDDPGEAAKSSIWKTLGIKDKRVEGVGGGGGLFKAFQAQSKGDEKSHVLETSTVLQANPAAFSRSLSFHENS